MPRPIQPLPAFLFLSCLTRAIAADPIPGVVLDWDFEDGVAGAPVLKATDRSGMRNHGVHRLGSPTHIASPVDADPGGLALAVRGAGIFGSGIRSEEHPSLNLGLMPSFTVEANFRPVGDNGSANRTLLQRSDAATLNWSYGLYYEGDRGQANFGVADQAGSYALIYADVPNDGLYHRVAGVFDAGTLSLYVDGVLRTNLVTSLVPDRRPKLGVTVGSIFNGGYYFNGDIARVRLTSRALLPGEMLPGGEPAFEGVPQAWWAQWFGPDWATDPRARAGADPDSDGSDNATEYSRLTHPLDPDSGFTKSLRMIPQLEWRSVPGGVYTIERRESLASQAFVTVLAEYVATATTSTYVDPGETHPNAFYQIRRIR